MQHLHAMMKLYESAQHSVVAFSQSQGETQFVSSGPIEPQTPVEELIFEIGSITKVFTAILLGVLSEEGKVDPTAPLSEMSDELARVPSWITPQALTSHTSGLPRIHVPIWRVLLKPLPEDPYAAFTRDDLLAWMGDWTRKAPGKKRHAYSNLGVGLLGEAMALSQGKPFVDLLRDKVIVPLGLRDTGCNLSAEQQSRFVQPRNVKGKAVVPWTFQSMAAAGCLRASARDLARFSEHVIRAHSGPETVLDRAIIRTSAPIFGLGPRGSIEPTAQCSGWLSMKLAKAEPPILFHNGGTAGSTCTLYICPEKARALAVLSNNGIAANLLGSIRLGWSNEFQKAYKHFAAS